MFYWQTIRVLHNLFPNTVRKLNSILHVNTPLSVRLSKNHNSTLVRFVWREKNGDRTGERLKSSLS
jgi:hypothetical protein